VAQAPPRPTEPADLSGSPLHPEGLAVLAKLLREADQAQELGLAVTSILRNGCELLAARAAAAVLAPETGAHPTCIGNDFPDERLGALSSAAHNLLTWSKANPLPSCLGAGSVGDLHGADVEGWLDGEDCLLIPIARRDTFLGILLYFFPAGAPDCPRAAAWGPAISSVAALVLENAPLRGSLASGGRARVVL
jgi:hypothetical protein